MTGNPHAASPYGPDFLQVLAASWGRGSGRPALGVTRAACQAATRAEGGIASVCRHGHLSDTQSAPATAVPSLSTREANHVTRTWQNLTMIFKNIISQTRGAGCGCPAASVPRAQVSLVLSLRLSEPPGAARAGPPSAPGQPGLRWSAWVHPGGHSVANSETQSVHSLTAEGAGLGWPRTCL